MGTSHGIESNRDLISASLTAGTLADVLQNWEVEDLSILALELKRKALIAEVVDSEQNEVIEAIERLGWGDTVVRELGQAENDG